jgi:hypothetical protein
MREAFSQEVRGRRLDIALMDARIESAIPVVHRTHTSSGPMSAPGVRGEKAMPSSGCKPSRQPLEPEAIEAVMEVTKWLKPSTSVLRIGDSTSVQAAMRLNAEQASKRTMRRSTGWPFRGRLTRLGYRAKPSTQLLRRSSDDSMYTKSADKSQSRGSK